MSEPKDACRDVTPEQMPLLLQEYMSLRDIHKAVMFSLVNKFVYVRVPKVANSSIKYSIYDNERPPGTAGIRERIVHDIHYGPILRPGLVGFDSDILFRALFTDEFFRFSFVRNPYAKALSNYLDRYRAENSGVRRITNRTALRLRLIDSRDETLGFAQFLKAIEAMPPKSMEIHISPQTTQLMLGLIGYHEICSFEAIDTEWPRIAARLWKNSTPGFANKSPSKTSAGEKLAQYFTRDDIARLNRIYETDFEMLGYPVLSKPEDFLRDGALLRRPIS